MPKGIRLKPEQIVAKLREIEVKIGQGKDVLTACREAGATLSLLENLNQLEVENSMKRSLYVKKSKFSESQIVGILREVELGAKVGETCRKHGISDATFYKWETQYSGMTVSHLSQLRELQAENAKLKRMYADLALMHHALKDVVDRKL
jgi:putative transposase